MRIGGVIWTDSKTNEAVNEKRKQYDAHYELIGPHITITFPVEIHFSLEEKKADIQEGLYKIEPFSVHLNRWITIDDMLQTYNEGTRYLLDNYPNAENALFLLVGKGNKEIIKLKQYLSTCINQPPSLIDYPGYLTIGQTMSDTEYQSAQRELINYKPDYRFRVETFDLILEQRDGSWISEQVYSLGR